MNRRTFLASAAAGLNHHLSAASTKPPNLLFIMADQFRFDALSAAGNKILQTPNLDRIASGGAQFENAMCACPVCVPSRTGMLTGKSMANTRVLNNTAAGDTGLDIGPSFDNILHDRSYQSRYFGKWHAPYTMARTYDNKVAAIGVKLPGVANEEREYLAFVNEHVPPEAVHKGELLSREHMRPYTASPADGHYAQAQAGVDPGNSDKSYSQGDIMGLLHIPKEYTRAAYTAGAGIQALEQMKEGPFSLTCSLDPPHPPFFNVDGYWEMYPWAKMPLPPNFSHDLKWAPYRLRAATMASYHDPERIRRFTSIYYGMVKEVDDQIGRLLRKLDDLGLAQNTLVIFTADHGEMLGSHGLVSKMVFHEESVHVPLLMRLPGRIAPGTVVREPVSGMDLFATILDYVGAPAPARDGDSLRPLIGGRGKAGPDYRVSEWAVRNQPNLMVRTLDWKLMIANTPDSRAVDALYDLKNDPYEMRNLLGDPADRAKHTGRADEMKDRLIAWLGRVRSTAIDDVKGRKYTATPESA